MKESAAIGLGEVIKRTSADALKPSVVHITGPLIRILGDRFSYGVKVALLETLALLLGKVRVRVPVSVRHVAIGESNQELAKRNLCIFANLAKSIK